MKCERCNVNNATHHYKKSVNGVVTEKYLCASCAAEENMPFKIFSPPSAFPSFTFESAHAAHIYAPQAKCGKCGTTLAEFNETAYLGCADCYNELRRYIEPVIKKLQDATQHIGKVPKAKSAEVSRAVERTRLSRALERAITEEDFEAAARLRDEIRKIDSEGKQ